MNIMETMTRLKNDDNCVKRKNMISSSESSCPDAKDGFFLALSARLPRHGRRVARPK